MIFDQKFISYHICHERLLIVTIIITFQIYIKYMIKNCNKKIMLYKYEI